MKPWFQLAARCACVALLAGAAAARAQTDDAWRFQATVYGYLPSVGGTTTYPPDGGSNAVSVDLGDVFNLKFAFMGSLEARKGPWGAFTDAIYLNLGSSKQGSRALSIGGALPVGVAADVDLDLKGWLWTLAGAYRAQTNPTYTLDAFGGVRLLDIKQTTRWQLSGNIGAVPIADRAGNRETSEQNWDAIIGVKGRVALADGGRWFAPYYLDLGTGESDFTVQAMAGVGYSFPWGDVIGAWRYIGYEMKSGKPIEKLNFSGPGVAAVFRW
ncbi:MAG TPA: hypothetical protein VFU71_16235 [Burkholderiaceae bacterium]|nr:hypothetical protein [Burkholderiaceae bacterium]